MKSVKKNESIFSSRNAVSPEVGFTTRLTSPATRTVTSPKMMVMNKVNLLPEIGGKAKPKPMFGKRPKRNITTRNISMGRYLSPPVIRPSFNPRRKLSAAKKKVSINKSSQAKNSFSMTREPKSFQSPNTRYEGTTISYDKDESISPSKAVAGTLAPHSLIRCSLSTVTSDTSNFTLGKNGKYGKHSNFRNKLLALKKNDFDKNVHDQRVQKLQELISDEELNNIREEILKNSNNQVNQTVL